MTMLALMGLFTTITFQEDATSSVSRLEDSGTDFDLAFRLFQYQLVRRLLAAFASPCAQQYVGTYQSCMITS